MDDVISGFGTVVEALTVCKILFSRFRDHGFDLRKWRSNSHDLFDEFKDTVPRYIVYILFQDTNFEATADETDMEAFNRINSCEIPRCVTLLSDGIIQLLWFTDASSLAYATVIYCRQAHGDAIRVMGLFWYPRLGWETSLFRTLTKGPNRVYQNRPLNLLVSKTKGAAIKQVSVPRLELYATHLLSDFFRTFIKTLVRYDFEVFAWTDSKVALSWLSTHPRKCETFIANRTSQILEVWSSSQ
ncbi:hypothetical protein AVEN_65066-1 [Araneus ventricosus]|uniref:Uncharacterized protein n=1 Tax=Araneus ventricosus TaxID=182803 RepID=A0A4Y2MHC8_ARAVE|nr:hypothetical protein AVEN_65066-1 [Araneus ventricosus]